AKARLLPDDRDGRANVLGRRREFQRRDGRAQIPRPSAATPDAVGEQSRDQRTAFIGGELRLRGRASLDTCAARNERGDSAERDATSKPRHVSSGLNRSKSNALPAPTCRISRELHAIGGDREN